jgi:undecaprenol kinase
LKKVFLSFSFAAQGIVHALKRERNMKIHLAASFIVILMGIFFSLTKTEWLFVLMAIGGVISLELVNTAIERVVDLATAQAHPLAKQAKDVAAGAVFIFAIFSVVIGLIIFVPKIFRFFT